MLAIVSPDDFISEKWTAKLQLNFEGRI